MSFFVKRLESQGNNILKTLAKCMTQTADYVKEAVTRKQNQHMYRLEKHVTMPPVGEITLERMTDTRKPSKTLKSLKSKLPTRPYSFSTSFSMLCAESFRDKEITTLRTYYETLFHASSL